MGRTDPVRVNAIGEKKYESERSGFQGRLGTPERRPGNFRCVPRGHRRPGQGRVREDEIEGRRGTGGEDGHRPLGRRSRPAEWRRRSRQADQPVGRAGQGQRQARPGP